MFHVSSHPIIHVDIHYSWQANGWHWPKIFPRYLRYQQNALFSKVFSRKLRASAAVE